MAVSSSVRLRNALLLSLPLALSLVGAFFVYQVFGGRVSPEAAAYFSAKLKDARVRPTVIINDRSYHVEEGVVYAADAGTLTKDERGRALRLAYALTLAKRAPLLNIEGSNPDLLHDATEQLIAVRNRVADLQRTPRDAYLVRNALYPTDFLLSLERMERARRAFIDTGRDSAWEAYRAARRVALLEGLGAAERFSRTLGNMESRSLPAAILGGKLTKEKTQGSLAAITNGFQNVRSATAAQESCLRGNLSACPLIAAGEYEPPKAVPRDEEKFKATFDIAKETLGTTTLFQPVIALEYSSCLKGLSGPDYIFPDHSNSDTLLIYSYVGDYLIQPLRPEDTNGAVLSWFLSQGVSNLIYNPLTFYTCPETPADIARVKSVFLMERRLSLLPHDVAHSVLYESDTVRALLKTIESADSKTAEQLRMLYWAHQNRSAGMEDIVYDVALGLETILAMRGKNIPADISADFLFSTHSGYYGLLLGHNRTARSGQPQPYEIDESGAFLKRFTLFSSLKKEAFSRQLINDIKVYLWAHK